MYYIPKNYGVNLNIYESVFKSLSGTTDSDIITTAFNVDNSEIDSNNQHDFNNLNKNVKENNGHYSAEKSHNKNKTTSSIPNHGLEKTAMRTRRDASHYSEESYQNVTYSLSDTSVKLFNIIAEATGTENVLDPQLNTIELKNGFMLDSNGHIAVENSSEVTPFTTSENKVAVNRGIENDRRPDISSLSLHTSLFGVQSPIQLADVAKESDEMSDQLQILIAEVEASSVADCTKSEINLYKNGIDLSSKMENVIADATKENDIEYHSGSSQSNIQHGSNSVITQDWDLTNRLYHCIAEVTEGMDAEELRSFSDYDGDNGELSNLVADAIKRIEMETVNSYINPNVADGIDKCTEIITTSAGSSSKHISPFGIHIETATMEGTSEAGSNEQEKFICHHCTSKWSDYYSVKSHIIWNHVPELEKKKVLPILAKTVLVKKIFDKFQNLKNMEKKVKKGFPLFKFRIMFTKRKTKYYKCRLCDFKTPKEYDLRKHKSAVHNKPLLKCADCSYRTTVTSCLQRHKLAKHTKAKPYKCTLCNYSANQNITLQEHMMAKHTLERPHECPHCDYSSVQRSMLKDHIRSKHTHERNRNCPNCNYMSVSSATLRRHIMAKHTREKPYKCEHCKYSATQSGQLRKHTMAMHTKEKPFQCTNCPYKATQSYTLKLHVRRKHTRDKNYKCSKCSYTCSTNTYLKYHLENKHKCIQEVKK